MNANRNENNTDFATDRTGNYIFVFFSLDFSIFSFLNEFDFIFSV